MKIRVVALALLVPVPVLADAPAKQYEPFVDTDSQIVDQQTHLVWERPSSAAPYPAPMSFAAAQLHCSNAAQRLPTLKELLTLVDEEPHEEYAGSQRVTKMINQSAFKRTPSDADFWTSSLHLSGRYATVSFETGLTSEASAGTSLYVRCVTAQTD